MTRLKLALRDGQDVRWPDNPAPHITEWLFEIGPSVAGAMGEAPIDWSHLRDWEHFTGVELDAWEAATIRRLSCAFVAQRHAAEKPDCPEPYAEISEAAQARKIDAQFKAMLAAFSKG